MRRLGRFYKNMKLRTKMLWSYIIIVTMAVLLICFVMFFQMSESFRKQLLYSAEQSFSQAGKFMEYRIGSVCYVSNLVRNNKNITDILSKKEEEIREDIVAQNKDMLTLEDDLYSICNSIEIYQLSLYVPNYLIYSNQEKLFRNLEEFMSTSNYDRLVEAGDEGCWLPPKELYSADTFKTVNVLSYIREIRDPTDFSRIIGIQRVSIRTSDIRSIMEKSNITADGFVWIENSKGELLVCSDDERSDILEDRRDMLVNVAGAEEDWTAQTVGSEDYLVRQMALDQTDWTLVAAIPEEEFYQARNDVFQPIVIAAAVLIIAAIALSAKFAQVITRRISKLAHQMDGIQVGIWQKNEEEYSGDEIGQLFWRFDYMSTRLQELVAREYENGKNVKQAELHALQSQINPHFLYNTLDLINWEALDCGATRITAISQALAKFYKLSLNKGREFSSIREELLHVTSYVKIQNFRYDNRIHLTQQVEPSLMEYQILHIVLQPLAENSFLHGMSGKDEDEVLELTITGFEEDEDICIELTDNGCGMTDKQMEMILSEDTGASHGYGVRNIHTRLQLVYGESYGLTYLHSEQGGVTVRIRLPKRSED